MNTEQLKNTYPAILSQQYTEYRIRSVETDLKQLMKPSTLINTDKLEIEYLKEFQLFLLNTYTEQSKQIQNKLSMIERSQRFDCSQIQYLPDDAIYEIRSYLGPEIQYTRKFCILRHIDNGFTTRFDAERWLEKVPKKLILDLLQSLRVYANIQSKNKKEEWCEFIFKELRLKYNAERYAVRIDKLLEQAKAESSCNQEDHLNKLYKFALHISAFLKYRTSLESKETTTKTNLNSLKNKKIVVKK